MEDYTIIQGQTMLEVLFALLLTLITSYVYLSSKAYARRMEANHAKPSVDSLSMLPGSNLAGHYDPPSGGRAMWHNRKASIADWLAPLVVWAVVIWTLLAVVTILLGDS